MQLSDCFMPVIAYMAYVLKTVGQKQPPYEGVKNDVLRLLGQAEGYVKKGVVAQEDYAPAHFAVCAWVDEAILSSPWNQRNQWQREPLQRLFYQTTDAGEEFFEKLNSLGIHQREIREVYYLCLALGFMGRFIKPGDETLLEQLRTSNLKILMGRSVGLPSLENTELFPEAYPLETEGPGQPMRRWHFPAFVLAVLASPVVFFGILYFVYRFTLNGMAESILK